MVSFGVVALRRDSAVHPGGPGAVAYDALREAEAAGSFLPEEMGLEGLLTAIFNSGKVFAQKQIMQNLMNTSCSKGSSK